MTGAASESRNLQKLKDKLREMLQLDQADLDFGIYRIMNAKRFEIETFLDRDLLSQVRENLAKYQPAELVEKRQKLDTAIAGARAAGIDPNTAPNVKQLQAQIDDTVDIDTLEEEIYANLTTFFSRYYQSGDFMSLRRYKDGVYAMPYAGEEVKLHWANADQYYIKSSESFRNYAFIVTKNFTAGTTVGQPLAEHRRVRFDLVSAGTERDNNKAQAAKERRFFLDADAPIATVANDKGENELVIRFHYRPDEDGRKQADINTATVTTLLELSPTSQETAEVPSWAEWQELLAQKQPTKASPDRTLIEKHVAAFTAKNSFDYFIHKDLGGFLRRELDFFIKNEIMFLDDIESDSVPRVEQYLSKIKVLRGIAHKLIDFLAQLEDFQKKLWLKKKFVLETNWLVTLDRVPEDLYPEIAANDAQREEWVKLFKIDQIKGDLVRIAEYSEPLSLDFLKQNPFLIIDTSKFRIEFKDKILNSFDNIDDIENGFVMCSDNFHALNFLSSSHKGRFASSTIDPPYNTGDDGFIYKDGFNHSSWISFIYSRISLASGLLREGGVQFCHIDDNEFRHTWPIMNSIFGDHNYLGSFVWKRRSSSAMSSNPLSLDHEYVLSFANNINNTTLIGLARNIDDFPYSDENGRFSSDNLSIGMTRDQRPRQFYEICNPITGTSYEPPQNRVWRFTPDTMEEVIRNNLIIWPESWEGNLERPRYKTYYRPEQMRPKPLSSWIEGAGVNDRDIKEEENEYLIEIMQSGMNQEGTRILDSLSLGRNFPHPKPVSLIRSLARTSVPPRNDIIDYFAGSGSTGHAIISLNREDGGQRKFTMIELGIHFYDTLLPRIMKCFYSEIWRNGIPVDRNGMSCCVKYVRLESYEDCLDNLAPIRTQRRSALLAQHDALREDYTLRYMLDLETADSLLDLERFADPDGYTLSVVRDDVRRDVPVDLVETFNYLIGLKVRTRRRLRGVLEIAGETNVEGDRVLVLWRNTHETDNDALDAWFQKQAYSTQDSEFDLIYVNGDNTLENLRRPDETWKVRLIETTFHARMFDMGDA